MKKNICQQFAPLSISLSPNVQKDDVRLALALLLQPWKWKQGAAIKKLEDNFKNYLGVNYAFAFNSGRSSLFAILKSLELTKGSNVLLQAFTCNAVPNPILWAGLNPLYIDCDNNFTIDVEKLKVACTMSKVLVLQHTFGLPANLDEIVKIAKENNMIVIEDCAHALGARYQGKKVGTFGDAAFFSFARDKVISCVYGGLAVTNNDELGKKLAQLQKDYGAPSNFWTLQQLLHPLLLHVIILPLYNFIDLGKIFLVVLQWLHLLSKAVSWQEKQGQRPDYFPKALPNALALMAQNQFDKLETFNAHRQKIAGYYYQELAGTQFGLPEGNPLTSLRASIFLRFAVTHPKAREILYQAWHKENILLGDWYTSVIAPDDTKLDNMKYSKGSCPNAERLGNITINLPTHINISLEDAKRIVNFLKKWN